LKERSARLVLVLGEETDAKHDSVKGVAKHLDIGIEPLRS